MGSPLNFNQKNEIKKMLMSFEGMVTYFHRHPAMLDPEHLMAMLEKEQTRIHATFKNAITVEGKEHACAQLSAVQLFKVFMIWLDGCMRTAGKFGDYADVLMLEGLEAFLAEHNKPTEESGERCETPVQTI